MTGHARRSQLAAALLSSCVLFTVPAMAQEAPSSSPGDAPDTVAEGQTDGGAIVVTGIRRSLASAISTKRNADTIVDAIGAEDVGKFPDANVNESLQRITGVQITRARGEGQAATIRGMPPSFTQVQYNGRTLANAIGDGAVATRSFNFTSLPSEFVGSLEVHKTPTADIQEGGLAGTVIMRTPRALDIGKQTLVLSAQGAWEDNTREIGPRLSGLYTNVFADGKLGIAVGASYTDRTRETHQVEFLGFRDDLESLAGGLDLNGDGKITKTQRVEYGNSIFLNDYTEKTKRSSGFGSIEFKPSDVVKFHADGFYSHLDDTYLGNTSLLRYVDIKGPTVPSGIVLGAGGGNDRAVKFLSNGIEIRPEGRVVTRSGDLQSYGIGGDFTPGSWTISFEGAYSRSTQVMSNLGIEDSGRFQIGYDTTVDGEVAQPVYGPGVYEQTLNPNNYQILTLNGSFNKRLKDELRDFRLDVTKDFDTNWLSAIKTGFRFTDRTLYNDNGRLVLTSGQINSLLGGTLPQSIFGAGTYSAASLISLSTPSRGRFLGSYDGPVQIPQSWLVSNTKGFLDKFSEDQLAKAGTYTNDASGIIDVAEKTSAGYALARFGSGTSPVSGNIGVRVIRTEQTVRGISPDFTKITFEPAAGAKTTIPAAETVKIDRGYTDWLPSANLRWNITDKLTMRLAASKTMARPELGDISPTATASGTARTIVEGNPYLDPFRAKNFDASLEWYFSERGLVSATFFYKDLESLIRTTSKQETITVIQKNADGSTQPLDLDFTVSAPINGAGVNVKGVELSYQQPFTFLPGPLKHLGFIGNYTYLKNSDPERLNGTSANNFNLSGYYEDGTLSARLAYTYRDTFLSSPDGGYGDGVLTKGFGTLDGNISVRVTRNFSAVIEATNILDADARTVSRLTGAPMLYEDAGRRFLFGVRGRF